MEQKEQKETKETKVGRRAAEESCFCFVAFVSFCSMPLPFGGSASHFNPFTFANSSN